MRKIIMLCGTWMLAAAMISGCGASKKAAEEPTETTQAAVDFGRGFDESGMLAGVAPADYVKVCDYDNLKIDKAKVTASDDEINAQIDSLTQAFQIKDRKTENGDTVNIDYVGTVDGKEFDGGSAESYDLTLGSHSFVDDFEDQLVGHKAGDKVEVKVTFPEDYSSEDLAGKDAVFSTTVNYIVPNIDKDVTDDFIKKNMKSLYGFNSVKDMKKDIKTRLENNLKTDYVWEYLVDHSTFQKIPQKMIDDRLDVIVDSLKSNAAMQGHSFEEYLSSYGYEDEDALREEYKETCENSVKTYLVADAIAKKENLSVTEKDKDSFFDGEDYTVYLSQYSESYINRVVLDDLVVKKILENAAIK